MGRAPPPPLNNPLFGTLHRAPVGQGPGASAPTAGQGLWVLVFVGACQGTAWAGLCLIHSSDSSNAQ